MNIFLDTETTGLDPARDELVEIAIVAENGEVLLNSLVRPVHNKSWPVAQDIHGISPEMVTDAPTLDELMPAIKAIVKGNVLVIYNSEFDLGFLPDLEPAAVHCCMRSFAYEYGEWSDYFGSYKWQSLSVAAAYVLFDDVPNHRALADSLACRAVWLYLHDDQEKSRVKGIKQEIRLEREAEAYVRNRAVDKYFSNRRFGEFVDQFLRVWWLRQPRFEYWATSWRRSEMEEAYAQIFFGKSLAYLMAEGSYKVIYNSKKEVPKDLWPASRFSKQHWYKDELEPCGHGFVYKNMVYPLYHCSEKERIDREFALRLVDSAPGPLYSQTDLKRLGYSKAQIESLEPYAERSNRFNGDWYYVYLKPSEEPALSRPEKQPAKGVTYMRW